MWRMVDAMLPQMKCLLWRAVDPQQGWESKSEHQEMQKMVRAVGFEPTTPTV